ncbi:hypothetical protein SCUP234_08810 [Seiridium cupressi]
MRQLITRSGAALTFYSEPRLTFVWPYSAALQGSDITSMNASKVDIIDLTGVGLPRQDCQKAAVWMAKAFAQARKPNPACFHAGNNHTYRTMTPKAATPALTMFFGGAPYESNVDMHETFWSSHLDRVAVSGMLIGAREDGEWRGFRAFFKPGKSRLPLQSQSQSRDRLTNKKRLAEKEDWDRFLELAGQAEYISRLQEWGEKSSNNNKEFGLTPSEYYTNLLQSSR